LDRGLANRIDYFFNDMLPRALHTGVLRMSLPTLLDYEERLPAGNDIDFWGVNYYYRLHVKFRLRPDRPFELLNVNRRGIGLTDMGWEIYPEGLESTVERMARHGKPVLITENGIATDSDELRVQFLEKHLAVVETLRSRGLPLLGYLYWSFLDNYEWLVGERARFGLYKVKYDNGFTRELRTSGDFFARYIRGQIEAERA
jgi:beta-glucosidase